MADDDLTELVTGLGHGRPAHEIVADALRRRIALAGYEPGELLPTERELAATLGIGRATLRRALRRLAAEGLVSTVPGRAGGTRVLAPDRSAPGGGPEQLDAQRAAALEDVLEVRSALEPLAARRAAERAEPAAREALERLVAHRAESLAGYTTLDTRFHVAVAAASGNPLLRELVERSREGFFAWANDLWFHLDLRARDDARRELDRSLAEHEPIAAAIAAGDAPAAEALMHGHVRAGAEGYRELFARARRS
jgi:GntR family transcriptional regulator, transcriptional repressor for pyruvate dehydrogenase complex